MHPQQNAEDQHGEPRRPLQCGVPRTAAECKQDKWATPKDRAAERVGDKIWKCRSCLPRPPHHFPHLSRNVVIRKNAMVVPRLVKYAGDACISKVGERMKSNEVVDQRRDPKDKRDDAKLRDAVKRRRGRRGETDLRLLELAS